MKNRLLHNWGLKLVSLLAAFLLWCIIARFGDPPDTRSFSNIQVRFINASALEDKNKVYEVLDNTDVVRVTVSAPKSVIDSLRASDIVAEADLSKLTDINTVAIRYNVMNANMSNGTVTGDRDLVKLSVEDRVDKWVRVSYILKGDVAEGYTVTSSTLAFNQLEISGPKSLVDQISHAFVELDIEGATSSIAANVEVNLYDKENNKLDFKNVTMTSKYILMKAEILPIKEIPVEIVVSGTPKEGYAATGEYTQSINTVKVAAATNVLSNLNKIVVSGSAVDITNYTDSLTAVINLNNYLPNGVKLVDNDFNNRITVTVNVEEIKKRTVTILNDDILILNIPEGMEAELNEKIEGYDLEVSGLARYVDPLNSESKKIMGMADIGKWMTEQGIEKLAPGTYSIPIQFTEYDGVTQLNRQKASIIVKKAQKPQV